MYTVLICALKYVIRYSEKWKLESAAYRLQSWDKRIASHRLAWFLKVEQSLLCISTNTVSIRHLCDVSWVHLHYRRQRPGNPTYLVSVSSSIIGLFRWLRLISSGSCTSSTFHYHVIVLMPTAHYLTYLPYGCMLCTNDPVEAFKLVFLLAA